MTGTSDSDGDAGEVGVGSNDVGAVGVDESLAGETVTWAVGARVAVAGTVVERLGTAVGVGKTDGVGVGTAVEITAKVRVGTALSCGESQPNIARPNKHPTTTIKGLAVMFYDGP